MQPVKTRIGWADFGDYEHFGRRLYRDFMGRTPFVALAAYALGGRTFTDEEAHVLDDVACAAHVTDPRVWPAKIARVLGTQGRPVLGMVAGLVVLDGDALGFGTLREAIGLVREAKAAAPEGPDQEDALRAFVRARKELPGFGVHQRAVDERVAALRGSLVARGRHTLHHWSFAERLWAATEEERGVSPNIHGAAMTALADVGLSDSASAALVALLFAPQFLAHAFDGFDSRGARGGEALLELPSSSVRYVGVPARASPRYHARLSRPSGPW